MSRPQASRRGRNRHTRKPRWPHAHVVYLESHYGKTPVRVIARTVGRTICAVLTKARDMGLQDPARCTRRIAAEVERRRTAAHEVRSLNPDDRGFLGDEARCALKARQGSDMLLQALLRARGCDVVQVGE